jgi:hypothetical protein
MTWWAQHHKPPPHLNDHLSSAYIKHTPTMAALDACMPCDMATDAHGNSLGHSKLRYLYIDDELNLISPQLHVTFSENPLPF